jgi:hypothetical protein
VRPDHPEAGEDQHCPGAKYDCCDRHDSYQPSE